MNSVIEKILRTFKENGNKKYGVEAVTQLEHALQSASLAEAENAPAQLIAAALLHDIGHILDGNELPNDAAGNLDDYHEEVGYRWLLKYFGPEVAEPVRLHVEAKRYLCTIDESYQQKLSPTSLKSFYDQGGKMNKEEQLNFEQEQFFTAAIKLRTWDDAAKDYNKTTSPIDHFVPYLEESLLPKS